LAPAEFIDIAEESGAIVPIGDWVLAAAVAAAARWRQAMPVSPPYVGVNVSPRQLRSPGFIHRVRERLADAGLPPDRLLIEVTESLLVGDDDSVWRDLRRLRDWGVRIAIDDFGTGYSALGYLRQVPLDVVKLDRIFVSSIATSTRQRALVEGIVRLILTLGLDAVAEGVETERERQLAADVGCAYGQGYFFGRPMPEEAVRSILAVQA
jgi:EAL domain-containing protein (putative c-di-GMP-specific phosphodiesterase class I)